MTVDSGRFDIGGYTTDVLLLRNGKPDLQFCRSLECGTITMNNEIIRRINARYDLRIDDEHISAVLNNEETILPAEVKAEICAATKRHAGIILNQLRQLQVDLLPAHEEDGEMIIYGSARHWRR